MNLHWPALENFQPITSAVVVHAPGTSYGPRLLSEYHFAWIIEGAARVEYDGRRFDAPAGTILLGKPGVTDYYKWTGPPRTVHGYYHFNIDKPKPPWPRPSTWPQALATTPDDLLQSIFRYLLSAQTVPEPLRSNLLGPCVDLMLRMFVAGKFGAAGEAHSGLPLLVEQALELICHAAGQDPVPDMSLVSLAHALHVSPDHLCRIFRQSIKLGPLECLRLARLERAEALVHRSNLTIKEISEISGFANPFHFSAAFKATYGFSPREYRKALAEGRPVGQNPLKMFLSLPMLWNGIPARFRHAPRIAF